MTLETPEKKRLVGLDDAAQALRLRRRQRGEQAVAPAPRREAADGHVGALNDLRQRRSRGEMPGVSAPKLGLAHPGKRRAGQAVEGAATAVQLVRLQAAETLSPAAVAAVADDLRPGAMWALMDGRRSPGDQRLGDALGQQTRGARLKIEQLLDRGLSGDLLRQRLESGLVHAHRLFLARKICERRRNINARRAGVA
jgi:hypothetical protein